MVKKADRKIRDFISRVKKRIGIVSQAIKEGIII